MKIRHFLPFLLLTCIPFASADIYMKTKAIGGLGASESWTSGKKQRMVSSSPIAAGTLGDLINITRADLGLKWEISEKLRMYQETPIPIEYTPEDAALTPEEQAQLSEFDKGLDDAGKAQQDDRCSKVIKSAQARSFAGMSAHSYRGDCPNPEGGAAATVWVADPGQPKAEAIKKEMDAFEKANAESMYSKYPPAERERTMKLMEMMGLAMSQGLMGMPNAKNLPQNLVLAMETSGMNPSGAAQTSMFFEIIQAEIVKGDASRFELPKDFTKVDNLNQAVSENMMNQFSTGEGKFSDVLAGFDQFAKEQGIDTGEGLTAEEKGAVDDMGQSAAQFVKGQMQSQGAWTGAQPGGQDDEGETGSTQQAIQAALEPEDPTELPLEEWQRNLYTQPRPAPPIQESAPQAGAPIAVQAQQVQPPVRRVNSQQQPQGQQGTQQTLAQVQGILNSVQGIASQFGGGGFQGGDLSGYQLPDGYQEESSDYTDQNSDDGYDEEEEYEEE